MTELARVDETHALTAQMDYARAVSSASMLPDNYRGKPADIMLAVGLGQSMGLSPAESLYRIAVIKGKPTASAELVAANVRKAGHRLRVRTDEQSMAATCSIWRADDPDFEFTVTRDMAWARSMKLDGNDNYRKQPLTMLANRASTACARLACPEALYGVAYTADEMFDSGDTQPTRAGGIASVIAERVDSSPAPGVAAPQTTDPEAPPASQDGERAGEVLLNTSSALAKAMYAAIREHGIGKDEAKDLYMAVTGREVESSKELTEDEARAVLRALDDREKDTPLIDVTDAEVVEEPS